MQIVFTEVGYIKLDHLSRKMCYTNCVIKIKLCKIIKTVFRYSPFYKYLQIYIYIYFFFPPAASNKRSVSLRLQADKLFICVDSSPLV